jgi:hypothetical protein
MLVYSRSIYSGERALRASVHTKATSYLNAASLCFTQNSGRILEKFRADKPKYN